jgi:hypothetical protein
VTKYPIFLAWVIANMATSMPRLSLRKRSAPEALEVSSLFSPAPTTGLPTVNSAFLSGLFADVAKVQGNDDETTPVAVEDNEPQTAKRSRTSLKLFPLAAKRSFVNLGALVPSVPEDIPRRNMPSVVDLHSIIDNVLPDAAVVNGISPSPTSSELSRVDSLLFQLKCVSPSVHGSSVDLKTADDAISLAFPLLSRTSGPESPRDHETFTLTRIVSDLERSVTAHDDNIPKESYGWFVEMDDDDTPSTMHVKTNDGAHRSDLDASVPNGPLTFPKLSATSATSGLAFLASTAPKASLEHDAAAEWAKAADTVDDVLGNFF